MLHCTAGASVTGLYRDLLLQLGVEPPFSKPRLVARIRSALDDLNANKHTCTALARSASAGVAPRSLSWTKRIS
jgi:hypothetical protein